MNDTARLFFNLTWIPLKKKKEFIHRKNVHNSIHYLCNISTTQFTTCATLQKSLKATDNIRTRTVCVIVVVAKHKPPFVAVSQTRGKLRGTHDRHG